MFDFNVYINRCFCVVCFLKGKVAYFAIFFYQLIFLFCYVCAELLFIRLIRLKVAYHYFISFYIKRACSCLEVMFNVIINTSHVCWTSLTGAGLLESCLEPSPWVSLTAVDYTVCLSIPSLSLKNNLMKFKFRC